MDTTLTLRPVGSRDWLGVLHVESGLDLAWDVQDHKEFLAGRRNVTAVACRGGHVLGFACATVEKNGVTLERLAVGAEWRRKGVGSALLWYLARTYVGPSRPAVRAVVNEYDLAGQLFFKANGFKWVETVRWADEIDEYLFQRDYRHG